MDEIPESPSEFLSQKQDTSLLGSIETSLGGRIGKQLITTERKLQNLANLDCLTQITNCYMFDEAIVNEWKRMPREKGTIPLIMCDIDSFTITSYV